MSDRDAKPKVRKESYAYAWSSKGDIYDQAYALNRGRLRRSIEQLRANPDLPVEQRKQSSMTVVASSPEVKDELVKRHAQKLDEIKQDEIDYRQDVAKEKNELSQMVRQDADKRYGWYNPMRYLYRQWGATSSTAYASDPAPIANKRKRLGVYESMLASVPEERTIHANMKFVEMSELKSGSTESNTRKLHLLGHGTAGLPAFATVQQPQGMKDYKLFDDLAKEFKQQGVLDKFTDIRMESCWSANPVKTDTYAEPGKYSHRHVELGETTLAPAVYLHREIKKELPDKPFQIKAYEGRGSQISNPIGQKQRNLTSPMVTTRQSTVSHVFSSDHEYK